MPCRCTAARAAPTVASRPMETGGSSPRALIGSVWKMSSTTFASAAKRPGFAAIRRTASSTRTLILSHARLSGLRTRPAGGGPLHDDYVTNSRRALTPDARTGYDIGSGHQIQYRLGIARHQ